MSHPPDNRILHVPRRFVREEWGGVETVVLELSREQQRLGWRPEVVTSLALARSATETIEGIPVTRFPYFYPFFGLSAADKAALDKKGGNLVSFSLFRHLLAVPNVRLFHAHALKRLGGEVRTAARLRKKPYVVTLHGGMFDVPAAEQEQLLRPQRGAFEWGKALGALFGSRRLLADADLVICIGRPEYDKARERIHHDRVALQPNGVDPARFQHGDGRRFRREHGIPADAFVVANISRIDAQKNQALLVRAFKRLCATRPESHLLLVGPVTQPDYAEYLRELIRTAGLSNAVTWRPGIQHHDPALVDAYHACDVFVLPSLHEPFGIVVLEAWSSGRAVAVSRVGGLRDLVKHGESGLFFEPEHPDAEAELAAQLEHLARQPEWRTQLGAAGCREVANAYDWRRINERTEALYQAAEEHAQRHRSRRTIVSVQAPRPTSAG